MENVDVTIIGAGAVGLAIAAKLSKEYQNIVILESQGSYGQGISSRNSEVVHTGIYYPTGSLKERLCVEGAHTLYSYCKKYSVPHKILGKLIVATSPEETKQLEMLFHNGINNGVRGLSILGHDDIVKIEPDVTATAAIYSSNTGIIDSHSLMKNLYDQAVSEGATFSFNSTVDLIEQEKDGYVIGIEEEDFRLNSRIVINSAGLYSDRIAELAGMAVDDLGYRLEYRKGSYFSYQKCSPVKLLVYPLPDKGEKGLGIHATLDLKERLRFGPDSELVKLIDFSVDVNKKDTFYKAASQYIRGLDKDSFAPDMSGIRPSIKGEGIKDFIIKHESGRDMVGFVNLVGIESPGLTASISIADYVSELLLDI
ncbi:MAG: NAD(P)/FAD-dependent oxidoreductase [Nitrospirota bacterium]|nr:MAG: NAD(P)/FAD-dependent oxidoreductase [Nitrospirota bacterium]